MQNKKHITLNNKYHTTLSYKYPKTAMGSKSKIKNRDRSIHGKRIKKELEELKLDFNIPNNIDLPENIIRQDALFVEFISEWDYKLKFDSLESEKGEFIILNIQEEKRTTEEGAFEIRYHTTLMMTEGGISKFINKVNEYLDPEKDKTGPRNQKLIDNIEQIQKATLRSFWVDESIHKFPDENEIVWWEVWLRRTPDIDSKINTIREEFGKKEILVSTSELNFVEHKIILVRGNAYQLSKSLLFLDCLSELRKPQEIPNFIFDKEVTPEDRKEWLEDLKSRTKDGTNDESVIICLLDSGVNNRHPLLHTYLPDNYLYTYNPSWGTNDNYPNGGHGTGVAGLSIYGDLTPVMASKISLVIRHRVESYKIYESTSPNQPELYGSITKEACNTPLIDRPLNPRIYCLTVCSPHTLNGRPSAWSSAIDEMLFESIDNNKCLFIISSGNVEINKAEDYPDKNYYESVWDPAQSYNAITVGAFTLKDKIPFDPNWKYSALASYGGMSPSNSTSIFWESKWPIKPDIVMEGGNKAKDSFGGAIEHELLLPISTHKNFVTNIFTPFGDTSGAAALAAKFAAELKTEHPTYWPETIRGLMIHSADWTNEMLDNRNLNVLKKRDYNNLLRTVGYGVPNQEKALYSASNSLTLIAERTIQPFKTVKSKIEYNEFHLFELPWPEDVLRDTLFDKNVTLKVTLSYFIEPNPGSRNKAYAKNFNYYSHELDFNVIKSGESLDVFKRRMSAAMDEPSEDLNNKSEPWLLQSVRSNGSIKKDFCICSGAELSTRKFLAVYPKKGWYMLRKKLAKGNSKVRYSLIISIETEAIDVDIYTPVHNVVTTTIKI